MKDDLEKTMEGKVSPENKKELLKQAVETLPTEFLCIDADVPFTSLDDADLRLKELTSKVMQSLHVKAGDAVVVGQPEASVEESREFADLLKEKGSKYNKFASLLDSVADTKNDPDKYLVDTSSLENDTKENIKKAIEILPTELLCINADVPFTSLDDADLRLKELVPKVMQTLHVKAGHAVAMGQPEASTEESEEFASLLRGKGSGYSKFASLLETVEQKGSTENKLTPLEQAKITVASSLHDQWRASRRKEDGTYEPRMKDDGLGGQVDIANTEYISLPEKWQAENRVAAETAVSVVYGALQARKDITSPDFLEEASATVHEEWMKRNPKEDWNAAQHVPYSELSEPEKQKDRDHVILAIQNLTPLKAE